MPLTEHLGDLRKRIFISLFAVLAAFALAFSFSEDILELLTFPLRYSLNFSLENMGVQFVPYDKLKDTKLVFLAPAEALWMHIKIAFATGLVIALPIIFHQFWRFISPGLLPKEKKYAMPFVFSATGLFLLGAAFCFFIVLPFAMKFLLSYKVGDILMPMLSVGKYIDFTLRFILAFGAVFELPVIIIFLTKMGVVTPKMLTKNRKYAVLIAFIVAAILTPTPDAFNQLLMVVPMVVLYEVGILISLLFTKKENGSKHAPAGFKQGAGEKSI